MIFEIENSLCSKDRYGGGDGSGNGDGDGTGDERLIISDDFAELFSNVK